jgi:hypothetical protein
MGDIPMYAVVVNTMAGTQVLPFETPDDTTVGWIVYCDNDDQAEMLWRGVAEGEINSPSDTGAAPFQLEEVGERTIKVYQMVVKGE